MSGSTLVSTTSTDVRPIALGGAPLHRRQAQIRAVVGRRLGERHFQLLSEPQPHDNDSTIDWYSPRTGTVQPLSTLPPDRRGRARSDIAALLHDIDQLGQSMQDGATEDCRLAGRLLRFAVHGPTDEHLFMIDDQPVMACWGYDFQGIGVMPAAPTPPAAPGAPATSVAAIEPPVAQALAPTAPDATATAAPAPVEAPSAAPVEPPAADEPAPASPEASATVAPAPVEPPPAEVQDASKPRRRRWLLWLLLALWGLAALVALLLALWTWDIDNRPPVRPAEVPAPSVDPGDVRIEGVAPPVTKPPQGVLACSAETSSGGGDLTRNRHYLGSKAGVVTIRYDMQGLPDELRVYYRGRLVATTQKPVRGRGTLTFRYQPDEGYYTVTVEVVGTDAGTAWDYTVGCPR